MHKIIVLNAKGGCGKTTIATSLACYFAGQGYQTALMDYDPQGSSSRWLEIREPALPPIKSIDAVRPKTGITRSWQLYGGSETEIVVIDTPAGITGAKLIDLYHKADTVLVPVMPSIIDLHAIEGFLGELGRLFKRGGSGKRLGVIANRVRLKTKSFHAIEQLIAEAGMPLLASLRDTQNYSIAMESGMGICELNQGVSDKDKEHWQPIVDWLQQQLPAKPRHVSQFPGIQVADPGPEASQTELAFSDARFAVS